MEKKTPWSKQNKNLQGKKEDPSSKKNSSAMMKWPSFYHQHHQLGATERSAFILPHQKNGPATKMSTNTRWTLRMHDGSPYNHLLPAAVALTTPPPKPLSTFSFSFPFSLLLLLLSLLLPSSSKRAASTLSSHSPSSHQNSF